MSKTMKKLISMFLCLAMVLTMTSILTFADEDDTSANTNGAKVTEEPIADTEDTSTMTGDEGNATAAPEASEAPTETPAASEAPAEEATPEPTAVPVSKYESDNVYNRALALATALGIITGYEDGSYKPESSVTRAEMAAIVLRMLNTTAGSAYSNSFNDVKADHWAADTIQTAAELSIINGMGDGSFKPDGAVTYEQVVKMIVCALGYDTESKLAGGYPSGYLSQANSMKVTDNAIGVIGEAADRGLVIKMVYNALLTYFNEPDGVGPTGLTTYKATRTLAKARFDIIDAKGVLTATSKRTLDPSFATIKDGQIAIDSILFDTELTGLEEYVGETVTYFYRETPGMTTPFVLAVAAANSKSATEMLDLDNVKSMTGFESGNGVIKMERGTDRKCKDAVINYNGTIITPADFARAVADDKTGRFYVRNYDGTRLGQMTFDDLLLPENGSVKLTDSDGDGNFDYIFVEAYETMTVTTVSSKRLSGKINGEDVVINIDTDSNIDLDITVIRAGDEVKPRNLKADDVASIVRSLDNNSIKIEVTTESVTGKVSSVGERDEEYIATIAGEDYIVDANAYSDVKSGTEGIFYTDVFGRIAFVTASGSGKIVGSDKYGWLMYAYKSKGGEYLARIYSQDGTVQDYELASTVSYWAPNAAGAVSLSGNDRANVAKAATECIKDSHSHQIRLCKFRVNSSNKVNKIHMACDSSVIKDDDAVIVDTANLRNVGALGSLINGRIIKDGIIGLGVPENASDINSAAVYSTFDVTSTAFLNATGVNTEFILGEFTNERDANILIRFDAGAQSAASIGDYSTAGDNNCMVVTSISTGIDEELEPIYRVTGRRSGAEITYNTSSNTILEKMSSSTVFATKDYYSTENLWTAESERPLTDFLHEGDVVGVSTNSRGAAVIVKMVDVKELANLASTGSGQQYIGYSAASETRDGIAVGSVTQLNTSDNTYFSIPYTSGGESRRLDWFFASSVTIDYVDVKTDDRGFVSADVSREVMEPSEMMEFDSRNIMGDYLFFRNFKNNAQREAVIFRFND